MKEQESYWSRITSCKGVSLMLYISYLISGSMKKWMRKGIEESLEWRCTVTSAEDGWYETTLPPLRQFNSISFSSQILGSTPPTPNPPTSIHLTTIDHDIETAADKPLLLTQFADFATAIGIPHLSEAVAEGVVTQEQPDVEKRRHL